MTLSAAALSVGQQFSSVIVDDLTRTQIVQYAGASGDYNPLHTDEVYAKEIAGYPGVFAHGMLTMGLTGKAITDLVGDGRLTKFGVRFTAQVWPGDTLTVRTTVDSAGEEGGVLLGRFSVETLNRDGKTVVSGYAVARLDP
jgi:acyl dehydratase